MDVTHKYSLPPKSRLRKYVLTRILGHGGFGLTYLATDTFLKREVAIKELLPIDFAIRETDGMTVVARSPDQEENLAWARRRFLEEGRILAALNHPSILPVHDIFEEHGTAYLITSFIEGETFEDWLRARGRPTQEELRAITINLLDALQLVHGAGYLHRDIKPENILMDKSSGRPVLIDFGNARVATGERTSNLTAVLSRGYAPFEQYQSKGRQGAYTDLYALGAVLYRAITSKAPDDSADRWGDDKVVPLCKEPPPGYTRDFLATVDRAMHTRADNRWQSCLEWKAALARTSFPPPPPIRWVSLFVSVLIFAALGIGVWLVTQYGPNITAVPEQNTPVDPGTKDPVLSGNKPSITPSTKPPAAPANNLAATLVKKPPATPNYKPSATPEIKPPVEPDDKGLAGTTPETATKERPFVNSLGMPFVPVPASSGKKFLICIHEARKKDYRAFAFAGTVTNVNRSWQEAYERTEKVSPGDDHPVVNVSLEDARRFCEWLNVKEARRYRLPSDHEWSCAVGIGSLENPADTPARKRGGFPEKFPSEAMFDPSAPPVGNYADESFGSSSNLRSDHTGAALAHLLIQGYRDGHMTTAPVMQFAPNSLGIFDLGGNVMEWCNTPFDEQSNEYVRRGGSWKTSGQYEFRNLLSSSRSSLAKEDRSVDTGFRCVLEIPGR